MRFRHSSRLRCTSAIVLVFFMWSFGGLCDIALAAKKSIDPDPASTRSSHQAKHTGESLEEAVQEIITITQKARSSKKDRKTFKTAIKERLHKIESLEKKLEQEFAETEKRLKTNKLPAEILKRHQNVVDEYHKNLGAFKKNISDYDTAISETAENDALERVEKQFSEKKKRKRPSIDFNNLPTRQAKPTKKTPRVKKEDFTPVQQAQRYSAEQGFALIYPEQQLQEAGYHPPSMYDNTIQVASAGPLTGIYMPRNETSTSSFTSPALYTEDLNPFAILAGASDLPTLEDLGETVEIQLTDAIRAKAAELNHDPKQIYEWVRNTIEFVPTWGSIQGADYCLQTLQGNSFDTASLLIALLRAAGVPARYVHGTIEVPIAKAMNWVGDFTDQMAAIDFIASGGIPSTFIQSGGEITAIRMEHIWVEAWIDYFPSRGARHQSGKGDMWVPLDAGYKQYSYTQGVDLQSAVPFDAESLIEQITNTATINEDEGYVTGVDSTLIQQSMQDFQTRVETYMQQNHPDATVGDVLGTKEIAQETFPYLLGTLPYRKVANGNTYSTLPDSLRHRLSLFVGDNDDLMSTIVPLNYSNSLPALAGKKITLSYIPATQADEDLINSFLPQPHTDGTPIDPSEIPTSLPAYLIKMTPEVRIDGEVVATGGSATMGTLLDFQMRFSDPAYGIQYVNNTLEVGEYYAIGLDLGKISKVQIDGMKNELEETRSKFESGYLTELDKNDLLGDLLNSSALAYYAELDFNEKNTALIMGINQLRLPSANLFFLDMEFIESFFTGQAISTSPGGVTMDVDHNLHVVNDRSGNRINTIQYMKKIGMTSSVLEHKIPEQLFSTATDTVEGISAVKALKLANEQNIPVFLITSDNIATVLPQLSIDQMTKANIIDAINAGKEVTVSKTNINFNGWNGCGYIVIDPETGSGAYLISGGLSGASFFWIGATFGVLFSISLFAGFKGLGPEALAVALSLLISAAAVYMFYGAIWGEHAQNCFITGLAYGLLAGGVGIGVFSSLIKSGQGILPTELILALSEVVLGTYPNDELFICI